VQRKVSRRRRSSTLLSPVDCRRPAGGPTRRSDIPYCISPPRADYSKGLLWLLLVVVVLVVLLLLLLLCG
jgi:hypothetical protein